MRTLSRPERVAWARLARTPRIGPITFHRLIRRFRSASSAIEALPRFERTTPLAVPSADRIEAELDALEKLGARLVATCEPDYPALLGQLDPPPPMIALRGEMNLLKRPTVAIVGAREASAAGLMMAEQLARDLGAAGFTVVSGLARGIDAAAHKGAIDTGTIAVLAGGLDQPYPPQNLKLHDAIAKVGMVVSEAPLGFVARARDFPRRNHIISGLSRAVIVIEAALRSGSLITSRAAADQGRDVMAVPGSPLDARSRGSNGLIKNGATLVESAEDVIAALGDYSTPLYKRPDDLFAVEEAPAETPRDDLARKIASLLSPTPIHVNDLARLAGVPVAGLGGALMELELEGRAASLPGGFVATAGASFQAAGG